MSLVHVVLQGAELARTLPPTLGLAAGPGPSQLEAGRSITGSMEKVGVGHFLSHRTGENSSPMATVRAGVTGATYVRSQCWDGA